VPEGTLALVTSGMTIFFMESSCQAETGLPWDHVATRSVKHSDWLPTWTPQKPRANLFLAENKNQARVFVPAALGTDAIEEAATQGGSHDCKNPSRHHC
jgi:hypothetical protein